MICWDQPNNDKAIMFNKYQNIKRLFYSQIYLWRNIKLYFYNHFQFPRTLSFPILFCLICGILHERTHTSYFKWASAHVRYTWQHEAMPSLKPTLYKLIIASFIFRIMSSGHCSVDLIVLKTSQAIQREFSKYLSSKSL